MPVIVVGRTGGWVDRLRAYRVTCNGVSYRLPANRSVRFDPTHGRVDVRAEIDWVRPAVWTGDVEAEQHLLIRPHHVAAGMFGAGEYLQIVPCRAEDISAPMPPETVRPARAFPSPRLALLRVVLGVVGLLAVRQCRVRPISARCRACSSRWCSWPCWGSPSTPWGSSCSRGARPGSTPAADRRLHRLAERPPAPTRVAPTHVPRNCVSW